MKLVIALYMLFAGNPMIREIACVSEIRCKDNICATKWVCPYGLIYTEPKEEE